MDLSIWACNEKWIYKYWNYIFPNNVTISIMQPFKHLHLYVFLANQCAVSFQMHRIYQSQWVILLGWYIVSHPNGCLNLKMHSINHSHHSPDSGSTFFFPQCRWIIDLLLSQPSSPAPHPSSTTIRISNRGKKAISFLPSCRLHECLCECSDTLGGMQYPLPVSTEKENSNHHTTNWQALHVEESTPWTTNPVVSVVHHLLALGRKCCHVSRPVLNVAYNTYIG